MSAVRRRATGVVLALLATLSPLAAAALPAGLPGGPTSAVAATPAPAPTGSGSATATAAPVTVEIDAVTPAVLHPGEDLTVSATLHNTTAAALDGVVADLRLYRYRPASRAQIESWVSGSSGAVGTRVVSGDPVSIPAGGSAPVQLTLPASGVRLLDVPGSWGPRGLAVEALAANGSRLGLQRTFLLWMRDEVVPQVRVAVVAPVTGATADPSALEQATGPGGRLSTLADLAAADPDVDLAVDPALVAAAAAGGPDATAWAASLTASLARRDTFALPWGDTDLAAVAHAGRPQLLGAAIGLSASSGMAGVVARTDVLWAPDGTLDQQTVDLAAASGAHALVVGTGTLQVTGSTGTAMVGLDTTHGTLAALVPDALLTTLMVAPDQVEPGATTATTVQRMLAEIAVLAHDGTGRQHDVLIAPGRGWTPDVPLVTALMAALSSSPWSRVVPVSALLGSDDERSDRPALPATVVSPGELPAGEVQALADARDRTTAFARAIGDPGTLTEGLDQRVLAPLSLAWRGDAAGREALVQQVLAGTGTTRAGLTLTGPPSLNVISASASVRFVVHNALTVPATVAVAVDPHKACLRPTRSATVTAPPGTDTTVAVDLVAVANCEVAIDAMLVGADGTTVGQVVAFSARVAPTIENVVTIVVGVLLVIGLALGIVRTVRRGRSARRGARVVPDDVPPLPVLGGDPESSTGADVDAMPAGPAPPASDDAGA